MRRFLTVLLFVLIAAKVFAILARGPVSIELDAFGYWRLSSLVLAGDLAMLGEPIAFRTPAYPYFLAAIRAVAGDRALPAIVAIQGVLAIGSILIAGLIAKRATRLPAAVNMTFLAALPAVSAYTYSAAVLSETLFVFLLMLNLLAVMDYVRFGTRGRAIWAGITFALLVLTKPIALFLFVPHCLFVLAAHAQRWWQLRTVDAPGRVKLQHRLGHGLIAAAFAVVICVPWCARNYHLFGSPQLTEFLGRNLWVVTFRDGAGAGLELPDNEDSEELQRRLANVDAGEDWQDTWTVSDGLVKSGLNDVQTDQLMNRVALAAIDQNRDPFARQAGRRIVNFWRTPATDDDLPTQGGPGNYRLQWTWGASLPPIDAWIGVRASKFVWANTAIAAVLAIAVILLLINSPTRAYGFWFLLVFAYFAVVTGILEIPDYRYRLVLEPLAAGTVGSAIAVLLSWRRKPATVEAAA